MGADRRLDADIAVAISGDADAWVVLPSPDSMFSHKPGWYRTSDDKSHCAPEYTASLDAAMTLVPERAQWMFDSHYNMAAVCVYWDGHEGPEMSEYAGEGRSPALALTAASVRARNSLPTAAPAGSSSSPASLHSLGTGAAEATGGGR